MKTLKGILQSKDMRQNDHRDDDMESPSAEPLSKKRVSGGKDGAEMQERPAGGHVPEVDEKEALLGGGGDWQSDASPATPGSLPAMMDGVPRVFRASWPSVLDQFMYTLRPALDVWCWFAFFLCFIYGPEHPLLYVLRGNKLVLFWAPFLYRLFTGFIHFLLSLAVIPGPVLYNEGAIRRFYPKWLLDTTEVHPFASHPSCARPNFSPRTALAAY